MKPISIDLNDFVQTSTKLGSNAGGFFRKKSDGSEYYIKWGEDKNDSQNLDKFKNEYLALKLYALFGVAVPKAELCTFINDEGVRQVGIMTAQKKGIGKIGELYKHPTMNTFNTVREKAQHDFIIDALLGNYDVVGTNMDNLHYDLNTNEPYRIEPGGALRYSAQGLTKIQGQFDNSASEFEDLENGNNAQTQYNPIPVEQASLVFSGAHQIDKLDNGLARLQAISDEQIRECVNSNYYDPNTPVGRAANETMIRTLLDRKATLIQKSDIKIALQSPPTISTVGSSAKSVHVNTKAELIHYINNGEILPQTAIQLYPQDVDVVKAAYSKNPRSLKYAHKDVINTLGLEKFIRMEDVVSAFSITIPTSETKQQTTDDFNQAMADKNWRKVLEICDLFWFEKPQNAIRQLVSAHLSNLFSPGSNNKDKGEDESWEDIFQFERAAQKANNLLAEGPLLKATETYLLEELARKMMAESTFVMKTIDSQDYVIFPDGTQFNWSKIIAHADFQHIDFNESDFQAYQQFMQPGGNEIGICTLDQTKENEYRSQLYDVYIQQNKALPRLPISYSEMQAINIYTGGSFFQKMNTLMRNIKDPHYPQNIKEMRRTLIHSVMCASGLRKIPITNIKVSYRGSGYDDPEVQKKRIQAAATHGTIKFEGFVSTATFETGVLQRSLFYTFKNVRGAYIDPIAQNKGEQEFLIPPTQVQLTNYFFNKSTKQHHFEGSIVSPVELENEGKFKPGLVDRNILRFTDCPTIVSLINSETGVTHCFDAVQAFPESEEIIIAAYNKCALSIREAAPSKILQLMENDILAHDAVNAFPDNKDMIILAYSKKPNAICYAKPSIIAQLTRDKIISPRDAINAFPKNEEIIQAIYDTDLSEFYALLNDRSVPALQAAKIGCHDENIITICYKQDPSILEHVSPLTARLLVENDIISPEEAVKTFPTDKEMIAFSYKKNPGSIKYAESTIIGQLIEEELIPAQNGNYFMDDHLITATLRERRSFFPEIDSRLYDYLPMDSFLKEIVKLTTIMSEREKNEHIADESSIYACYQSDTKCLMYDSMNFEKAIIRLLDNGTLSAEQLTKYFSNINILTAAYNKDPNSIDGINEKMLLSLYSNGVITIREALKSSVNMVVILESLYEEEQNVIFENETFILDLIKQKPSLGMDVIKNFRRDDDMISLVYKEAPNAICYADPKNVVKLIKEGVISTQDAEAAFPTNKQVLSACSEKKMSEIKNAPPLVSQANLKKEMGAIKKEGDSIEKTVPSTTRSIS